MATPPPGSAADSHSDRSASCPAAVPVTLVQPKYQRRFRLNRRAYVTDSSSDHEGHTVRAARTESERLLTFSPYMSYDEAVTFHREAVYRTGARQVHHTSVGYSSDGVVMLQRETRALWDGARLQTTHVEVSDAVRLSVAKLPQYGGLRCERNRRVRKRMVNDIPSKRLPCDGSDGSDEEYPFREKFEGMALDAPFPRRRPPPPTRGPRYAPDDSSGHARYQRLSHRLRRELRQAVSSAYLMGTVAAVEHAIGEFIATGACETMRLEVSLESGYARLLAHAVAAYYALVSRSVGPADARCVTVHAPQKRRPRLPDRPLRCVLGAPIAVAAPPSMEAPPLATRLRPLEDRSAIETASDVEPNVAHVT